MSGISNVQRQLLFEIAREAYGSGLTEGTRGGRGYMGLDLDPIHGKNGKIERRAFKFLTHRGENTKSLTELQWRQIDMRTGFLRRELLDIARDAGNEVWEKVRVILKLDADGEATDEMPRLLERKVVAKVITEIAKADKGPGRFDWKSLNRSRARTLADTSVNTVFSALGEKGIPGFARKWLTDFARVAFGSGKGEGSNGGRGCMGVYVDDKGREHTVKFLTHVGESTKNLLPWQWKEIDKMTDLLRCGLLAAAEYSGDEALRKVRSILKVDEKDEPTAETPRLLERKVVAQAITVIAEAGDISHGFLNWGFSWKQIASEPREPAEKDTSPAVVLDRLGAKQEAIGEGWTVIEGENESDWVWDRKMVAFFASLIRAMPGYINVTRDEVEKLKFHIKNFPTKMEQVVSIRELRFEAKIMEEALKNPTVAPETNAESRRKFLQDVRALSAEVDNLLIEAMSKMPDSAFDRSSAVDAGDAKDIQRDDKADENLTEDVDSEDSDGSVLSEDDEDW